jgi:hypothetical protein
MLDIGSFRSRTCAGITRRAFVRAAASVPVALGLPAPSGEAAAEAPRKAKSVLVVWLTGGPSHIDTFDPKPNAPDQYAGPFAPIATRTPGVRFSELLPRLAARSDRFAVVRSSVVAGGHDLSGLTAGGAAFSNDRRGMPPNFGSIVARHRGADRLPPFISVWPPGSTNASIMKSSGEGGGALGPAYDPFLLFCSAEGRTSLAGLKLLPGLSPQRLTDRDLLRKKLDAARRELDSAPAAAWDHQHSGARRLLMGLDSQKAFDLGLEKETCRDAYGHTSFGQSLLLGRRLVEAGVPYVQVNWSSGLHADEEGAGYGWDTHVDNFDKLSNFLCPILDRAFGALLDDLAQRGLLESTLVVALGEFGRSPRINQQGDLDGRNHWPQAGFTLWAGAGVQGGRIVGETDRIGADPLTQPITRLMIGTTIVELAGVDSQARSELKVLGGGRVIHELF